MPTIRRMKTLTQSIPDIGEKIKKRRKKLQITLQQMSQITKLSTGFLSQVERGISTPNLTSLHAISNALNVSPDYLVALPKEGDGIHFLPADKRLFHQYTESEEICPVHTNHDSQELDSLFVRIAPKGESEQNTHDMDEVVYCVSGTLMYHISGVEYRLQQGDVIYVPGNTPHKWSNPSDTEYATALWVGSLGGFR